MKYLGIDYGTKKIGLAKSDERGVIAFPFFVLAQGKGIVEKIAELIEQEGVEGLVVGKSLMQSGQENTLQREIERFAEDLRKRFPELIISFQDERFSSANARSFLYGKGNIENERWTGALNEDKKKPIDAGAAAIILQRYLDKQK